MPSLFIRETLTGTEKSVHVQSALEVVFVDIGLGTVDDLHTICDLNDAVCTRLLLPVSIRHVDACFTRLRVKVKDKALVMPDTDWKQKTGANGVVHDKAGNVKEKMMKRRVVVTGLGAVTPIGNTVEEFWTGIRNGKVGIGEITKFDTTDYKVKLAAEVKDFSVKERIDAKSARRMAAFSQYACAAAKEAYEDSGLAIEKEDPFRAGVIIGSGIGSQEEVEKAYEKILTKGPSRCNPLMIPMMISNMAAGNVSIQLGFRGKCSNVVTACASGTHCIGDAFRAIQYGDAEMMLAGGTESCICPTGVTGFMNLTALSEASDPLRSHNSDRTLLPVLSFPSSGEYIHLL